MIGRSSCWNLKEGIGIALDLRAGRLYATDLGGTVYSARLDGSDQKIVLTGQGSLTGIAVAAVHGGARSLRVAMLKQVEQEPELADYARLSSVVSAR